MEILSTVSDADNYFTCPEAGVLVLFRNDFEPSIRAAWDVVCVWADEAKKKPKHDRPAIAVYRHPFLGFGHAERPGAGKWPYPSSLAVPAWLLEMLPIGVVDERLRGE